MKGCVGDNLSVRCPEEAAAGTVDASAWARSYAAGLSPEVSGRSHVRWLSSTSGASLAFCEDVVLKLHHERTDEAELSARLRMAADPVLAHSVVAPLTLSVGRYPGRRRLVTAWPRVDVLEPGDVPLPWADAGALLAGLHASAPCGELPGRELPPHGGVARLERAVERLHRGIGDHTHVPFLLELGRRLLAEVADADRRHAQEGRRCLVHGDWHLGQLARTSDGWRLIDIDDLGLGHGAWDLGRPAGFWAAGLLDDQSWNGFLTAYREAGGRAVPPGDPWATLDLPARCAVYVATVREVRRDWQGRGTDALEVLLQVCRSM